MSCGLGTHPAIDSPSTNCDPWRGALSAAPKNAKCRSPVESGERHSLVAAPTAICETSLAMPVQCGGRHSRSRPGLVRSQRTISLRTERPRRWFRSPGRDRELFLHAPIRRSIAPVIAGGDTERGYPDVVASTVPSRRRASRTGVRDIPGCVRSRKSRDPTSSSGADRPALADRLCKPR